MFLEASLIVYLASNSIFNQGQKNKTWIEQVAMIFSFMAICHRQYRLCCFTSGKRRYSCHRSTRTMEAVCLSETFTRQFCRNRVRLGLGWESHWRLGSNPILDIVFCIFISVTKVLQNTKRKIKRWIKMRFCSSGHRWLCELWERYAPWIHWFFFRFFLWIFN